MPEELVENYVPFPQLAECLPESSQALRYHLPKLPTRRTGTGRIFVERAFALRLLNLRHEFSSLSAVLAYLNHGLSNSPQ